VKLLKDLSFQGVLWGCVLPTSWSCLLHGHILTCCRPCGRGGGRIVLAGCWAGMCWRCHQQLLMLLLACVREQVCTATGSSKAVGEAGCKRTAAVGWGPAPNCTLSPELGKASCAGC